MYIRTIIWNGPIPSVKSTFFIYVFDPDKYIAMCISAATGFA
jgi:hypothetical protein